MTGCRRDDRAQDSIRVREYSRESFSVTIHVCDRGFRLDLRIESYSVPVASLKPCVQIHLSILTKDRELQAFELIPAEYFQGFKEM